MSLILTETYLTIGDKKIRYRVQGQGPAVLFTHGVGASLETWDQLESGLNTKFQTISWDYPGHGLSDHLPMPYTPDAFAELAWQLLDFLNIESVYLVGNSFGGAVSLRMLNERPAQIKGAALLNAAALGYDNPIPFRLSKVPLISSLLFKANEMAITNQIKSIFYKPEDISEEVKTLIRRNVMRPGNQKGFLKAVQALATLSGQNSKLVEKSYTILRETKLPLLIVHGRQDAVIPVSHSEHAHSISSNSTLLTLEECGHTPQIEKPKELTSALLKFIS